MKLILVISRLCIYWLQKNWKGFCYFIPATISLNLDVDTCNNPNQFPEAHLSSSAKVISGQPRARYMIKRRFLFNLISLLILIIKLYFILHFSFLKIVYNVCFNTKTLEREKKKTSLVKSVYFTSFDDFFFFF